MNRTFSWTNPKVWVRNSDKNKKGVFAKSNIDKGDVVAVSGGYVFTAHEFDKLPNNVKFLTFQVEENLFMGIKNIKEIETNWFFNHSCNANLGQLGQISLVAMKKIRKGEELTFDYATALCKPKGFKSFKMKCHCGSRQCRGIITDNDWKIPALQKKYKGYFQTFLEEKIRETKSKKAKK